MFKPHDLKQRSEHEQIPLVQVQLMI